VDLAGYWAQHGELVLPDKPFCENREKRFVADDDELKFLAVTPTTFAAEMD
jgi:hypothetical protein